MTLLLPNRMPPSLLWILFLLSFLSWVESPTSWNSVFSGFSDAALFLSGSSPLPLITPASFGRIPFAPQPVPVTPFSM